ncbi:MAG: diadenylate cyclase CdaA [bacterium]
MSLFNSGSIIDVIDILVLTALIYQVLIILQRTRATQLILGIVYFVVLFLIAYVLRMSATVWVFERLAIIVPFALIIIFQRELRSFFERAGQRGLIFRTGGLTAKEDIQLVIETIVQALEEMSAEHIGALIVIEREINLKDYINTGERIDANLRKDLLKSIFYKGNPLHDGAVIIRGDRIISARSFLPLSESRDIPSHLGTRHRSALGITEISDAISLVASEETGHLSLFNDGKPAFRLTPVTLRHMVEGIMIPDSDREGRFRSFTRDVFKRAGKAMGKRSVKQEPTPETEESFLDSVASETRIDGAEKPIETDDENQESEQVLSGTEENAG